MSTREKLRPYSVITSGNIAGSLTSSPTVIQGISMLSYSYSWTGSTPVGAISIQVSNDYALNPDGSVQNAGTWNTITFTLSGSSVTSAPVSGNTGNGFIDIDQSGAYAIRTVYTRTSGTGTLQAIICGKVS